MWVLCGVWVTIIKKADDKCERDKSYICRNARVCVNYIWYGGWNSYPY